MWDRTILFPLELELIVLLVLLQAIPGFRLGVPGRLAGAFHALARRRLLAVAFVGLFTIAGHAVMQPGYVIPPPGVPDEFSNLLTADTLAAGRLANPPHPMRFYLESIHILSHPVYAGALAPGNALFPALGQAITGHAISGVWIGAGLFAAALCWALQGWMPPGWALLGGLLAAVRIGWFSYWANSYWGGSAGAIGGCLLFGAIPRLGVDWRHGATFGAGIVLAVISNFWEGAVMSLAAIAWVVRHLPKKALLPAALVVAAGLAWLGYYHFRVTGSVMRSPYLENRAQYESYGTFVWQGARKPQPDYNHEAMRAFYVDAEGYNVNNYWATQTAKLTRFWFFFAGPALTVPLLGLWGGWRQRKLQLGGWIILAVFASHLLIVQSFQPHQVAPLTAPFYLFLMTGLRRLRTWRRQVNWGAHLTRAAMAACLLMLVFRSAAPVFAVNVYREPSQPWYSYGLLANFYRDGIERRLTEMGGRHLVLVSYSEDHQPTAEWVYNRADIDAATVVWARRHPDRTRTRQLLEYFKDRKVWTVKADDKPNTIDEYEEAPNEQLEGSGASPQRPPQ